MTEEVKLIQSIDDRDVLKAWQQQARVLDKVERRLDKIGKEGKQAGDAISKSGRDAEKVWLKTRKPLERYLHEMSKLRELLKSGAIDQETFNRAQQRQKDLYRQTSAEAKEAGRKSAEAGRLAAKVWDQTRTPLERYKQQFRELRGLLRSGKIDQETFNRAKARERDLFRQATGQTRQATTRVREFVGAVTGIGSVVGAVAVAAATLRRELDDLRQRQGKTADTQIELAAKRRAAAFNLGPEQIGRLEQAVARISEETGVRQTTLFDAFSTGLSAKSRLQKFEDVEAAVRQAVRVSPDAVEEQRAIVQGILAQQQAFGGTAKQALGQQIVGKQASPVVTSREFGQFIVPAAAQLKEFGNTAKEAFGLLASLGTLAQDRSGRSTQTAAVKFARDVELATPQLPPGTSTIKRLEFIRSGAGTEVRKKLLGQLEAGLSEEQRVAEESGKPGLTTEARFFTALIGFLQAGETRQTKLLQKTISDIPTVQEAGKQADVQIAKIDQSPIAQTAQFSRTAKTGAENIRLARTNEGRVGVSREALREILEARGQSATARNLEELGFDAFGQIAPTETVVSRLRSAASRAEGSRFKKLPAGIGGPGTIAAGSAFSMLESFFSGNLLESKSDREATATELRKVADQLEDQSRLMQEQNELLKQNAENKKTPQRVEVVNQPRPRGPVKLPSQNLQREDDPRR